MCFPFLIWVFLQFLTFSGSVLETTFVFLRVAFALFITQLLMKSIRILDLVQLSCVRSWFQWYILPPHHWQLYPLKCIICIYFSLWSLTTEGKFTGRGRVEELGALNRGQTKCIRTGNATAIILFCFKSRVPHGQHQLTSKTWFCSPLLHPADSWCHPMM